VLILSDGNIGQSSEPWKIPSINNLPEIQAYFTKDAANFAPYKRDEETLRRQWAIPGFEGMEHRIGGLEKEDGSGNVSSDGVNHEKMVHLRQEKINRIALDVPDAEVLGEQEGDLLMLSWGSTFGAAKTAFEKVKANGHPISFCHLRYMNPFPKNLGEVLGRFQRVLLPELNMGQLKLLIQGKYLKPVIGMNKVQGKPFKSTELEEKILSLLTEKEILV
jgi:2-oxoglutarate ferredoxin oxidoreductase subunit alpha